MNGIDREQIGPRISCENVTRGAEGELGTL
jgi:hypothetical protein